MLADDLTTLAKSPDAASRRRLLHWVTDCYLADSSTKDSATEASFASIVLMVFPSIGADEQAQYSNRIADEAGMPRGVVIRFAKEGIEIAEPVLSRSPVLTDQDLIEISAGVDDDHLLAMSRRQSLSEALTDVLIGKGSLIVIQSTTRNPGASLSRMGFRHVVTVASRDGDLNDLLLARADLSTWIAREVKAIVADSAITPRSVPVDRSIEAEADGASESVARIDAIIERIEGGASTFSAEIQALTRADRALDLAVLVQRFTGVSQTAVMGALANAQVEQLMTILKKANAPWETVEGVVKFHARRHRNQNMSTAKLQQRYEANAAFG